MVIFCGLFFNHTAPGGHNQDNSALTLIAHFRREDFALKLSLENLEKNKTKPVTRIGIIGVIIFQKMLQCFDTQKTLKHKKRSALSRTPPQKPLRLIIPCSSPLFCHFWQQNVDYYQNKLLSPARQVLEQSFVIILPRKLGRQELPLELDYRGNVVRLAVVQCLRCGALSV